MTAPDDITPEEIAAIEARCDAATPGPWNYAGCERHPDAAVTMPSLPCVRLRDAKGERVLEARPNQILAAHARTDIPRLLAALRRRDADLSTARDNLQGAIKEMMSMRKEIDAANAKLARAVELLRSATPGGTDDDIIRWVDARAALLAEIEAHRGK